MLWGRPRIERLIGNAFHNISMILSATPSTLRSETERQNPDCRLARS